MGINKLQVFAIVAILLLSACNPCKFVAKHQECFPADTVRIENETVRFEKIYITEDSLIYDTVPCDPVTEKAVHVETVYKTIYKTRIDTIYKSKEVAKINPVNKKLKDENEKLIKKLERKKVIIWGALGAIILTIIVVVIKRFFL